MLWCKRLSFRQPDDHVSSDGYCKTKQMTLTSETLRYLRKKVLTPEFGRISFNYVKTFAPILYTFMVTDSSFEKPRAEFSGVKLSHPNAK